MTVRLRDHKADAMDSDSTMDNPASPSSRLVKKPVISMADPSKSA